MRPCRECGEAVGNAEKHCPACGAPMLASIGLQAAPSDVEPATPESIHAADPAGLRNIDDQFKVILIGLVVAFFLLLGGLVWAATGSLMTGIFAAALMFVVGGMVIQMGIGG
jgi:hypothetical protein